MATLEQWRNWSFPNRGRFNDWCSLTSETIRKCPNSPGVYLLAVPLSAGVLQPRPLGRLFNEDPQGIIDIGEAQDLAYRLTQLLDCCTGPGTRGHMAGWRLGRLKLIERLGLEAKDLLILWHAVPTKSDAYEWEGWLLRKYLQLFGELPPLNYKFNWSAFTEEELA